MLVARVMPAIKPTVIPAWGAIEPVVVKAVAAFRAIVPPIANPLLARATSSPILVQLAIMVAAGMVTVKEAIATSWLMMTALAFGPVPIRLVMMKLGCECIQPNFDKLCIRKTVPVIPTRNTAKSTSLVRVLTLLASVVAGAKTSVKALMFWYALSFTAMLLKCCAQLMLRMAIFVLLVWKWRVSLPVFLLLILQSHL